MGRWGEELFAGDMDLDIVAAFSDEAGIELYHYEINEKDPERGGRGINVTRELLNSGVLDRLFEKYIAMDRYELYEKTVGEQELVLLLLGALAMRVGATINLKHLEVVRHSANTMEVSPKYSWPLSDTGLRGPGKRQILDALRFYKNDGTPFNFHEARCEFEDCRKSEVDLADGKELLVCGKCKEVKYCGRSCQESWFAIHKKTCKTPEKRAQEEAARQGGGRGYTMLNV